ncbi:serine-threonine protein kinase, putative [Entamoeba invadens IP1]|uniref:Serine-threonine protein kinase, putative n=1 Tax=Entamoeba invadens IP1 TaxID=370355 RepID=L7FQB5_ENTIV|nr:serine-threonine protein kinase, putative [Entamoeba invadens IP1]ELP92983.1 serine-threonine protein kinase, putative [Entamoeba invadens IP1]|eukprot:XP_004259754.1 serine-threonine protein kinase, putative [Entamoeba invadens IP1]
MSNDSTGYIKDGDYCKEVTTIIVKQNFLPNENDIEYVPINTTFNFEINQNSTVDKGPCFQKNTHRLGKWIKIKSTDFTTKDFYFTLTKPELDIVDVFFDGTYSQRTFTYSQCRVHYWLNTSQFNVSGQFPKISPYPDDTDNVIPFNVYFFISVRGYKRVNLTIEFWQKEKHLWPYIYEFSQSDLDYLAEDLSRKIVKVVPVETRGIYVVTPCTPRIYMKAIFFTLTLNSSYSVLVSTKKQNRVTNMVEMMSKIIDEKLVYSCAETWGGVPVGVFAEIIQNGVFVRIKGDDRPGVREFAILSDDHQTNSEMEISVICPNHCHEDLGHGYCFSSEGRCVCKPGYGGDDCHMLCYYNDKWQVDDYKDLCYFGEYECDQYCKCQEGHALKNHLCVSTECINGGIGSSDECILGTEGCQDNCHCNVNSGYIATTNSRCKLATCGNGKIDFDDNYYNSVTELNSKEECDNGTNCNEFCKCNVGFKTDIDNPIDCIPEGISTGIILAIVFCSTFGAIVFITIIVVSIYSALRYKKIDVKIFKTQQPNYHFYITGSVNETPSKNIKYDMRPLELDFGNKNKATLINDTRFEKVDIRNLSKMKWMMVIFHTTNSPKFVFHFSPQVVFLRPNTKFCMTVYMTLHCSTKIKNMKIPYTVWHSKSKKTLVRISEILKGKTFDEWTQIDKKNIERLCEDVKVRTHNYFTIKTEATSSTQIDMDELNIAENPIAEGAMGKVFIGNYRSVPVAVKQFKWDNLDDNEMTELKKSVVAECEIMSKLRNPFIANYMGSVTYLKQVSMVIQFFVLGSLGEYLRKEKEDFVILPYKLKVRMLFDTARGMQFLHENKIMHLDLKPENLLVNSLDSNSVCSIKITDFGTSRFTKKSLKKGEEKGLGTPIYGSPESFRDEYTYAGDVYSYGITAWEIFYQQEPYKEFKSIFEIKNYVENGKRLEIGSEMPRLYRDLVEECWRQTQEIDLLSIILQDFSRVDEDVINHMLWTWNTHLISWKISLKRECKECNKLSKMFMQNNLKCLTVYFII